jgi:hypothetical protein
MECQNAFDTLVSETEQPDAERLADIRNQYKLFEKKLESKDSDDMSAKEPLRIVDRKSTADPNFDEIKFNREPTFSEVKQMCSDEGISIEDETIPTLTKETIDAATEAFLDEDYVDEVNEAACTDFCEEDALDEGDCDGNCIKCEDNCAKVKSQMETRLGGLGSETWKVDMALKYIESRQANRPNMVPYIIAEVYNELNDTQRRLIVEKAPWLAEEFNKVKERQANMRDELRIEEADEKSKQQAEKLTAKMEGKTGDWKADRQKAAHDAWNEFYEKWDRLPKDIQDTLAKVPDFMLSLNMYREEMTKKQMEDLTDYDPEKTVNDLSKAHEQGNISAADAAKVMNEPTMISNFMWNNPEFNQWNQERFDYSSDNCAKINKQFDELQKNGVIPPTNKGQPFIPKDQYNKQWFHDPSADLGNTMIYGMKPSMGDTVKDGNGAGKGDCTVADVWEQDVARVQKVNQSFKITPEKKPLTPEESLAELMSDMPKAMVDKILTIPSEAWTFTYQGEEFVVKYSMASRDIVMTMTKGAKFSVNYINRGPGSVHYVRQFDNLNDITTAGKNSKRLYQWFGRVLSTFFSK